MSPPPPAPETPGTEELEATSGEVLEPDEAPTPAWLPLVGLGVLFMAMLGLLAARPAGMKSNENVRDRVSVVAEPSADPFPPPAAAIRAQQPVPAQPTPKPAGCAE